VIRSSSTICKQGGITLLEALLSGFLFLVLLTAIFSLLTHSVRLLEPSSDDKLSEVLLLASKIRADIRSSTTVTIVSDSSVTLTGVFEEAPFIVTYSAIDDGVLRESDLPALGPASAEFFLSADKVVFETRDELLVVSVDVQLGERAQTLLVKAALPVE
jgi:hypothetical protein